MNAADRRFLLWQVFVLSVFAVPALPCTCASAEGLTAKSAANDYPAVFRGTVVERKMLPQRPEMRGRNRYAITFRVDEYWKGTSDEMHTLYGLDAGTDCLGDGGYQVGKNYLVYAGEQVVRDEVLDGFFWFGWTDVLPERTHMLIPVACAPGGETTTTAVRKALRQLGKGYSRSAKDLRRR